MNPSKYIHDLFNSYEIDPDKTLADWYKLVNTFEAYFEQAMTQAYSKGLRDGEQKAQIQAYTDYMQFVEHVMQANNLRLFAAEFQTPLYKQPPEGLNEHELFKHWMNNDD